MNSFVAIAGIVLLVGLFAGDTDTYVNVDGGWNDDVGSRLKRDADNGCSSVNKTIGGFKKILENIQKLPPIELNSEADNINKIIDSINHMRVE